MSITIQSLTIENVHLAGGLPSMASSFLSSLFAAPEPEAPAAAEPEDIGRPVIGQEWLGQGGIYAGDFRGGDGTTYSLIVGKEEDIGRARWAPDGERDLSDWDGLANTARLVNECPAAKLAAGYVRDEHTDFYLPARRELLLAAANLHDTFGKESWYWTSTAQGEYYAWAVGFEDGRTNDYRRNHEFRVRPFRRFIY